MIGDLIAADDAHEHHVWTIGPSDPADAARGAGLIVREHVPAPRGRFWPAWWSLRRRLKKGALPPKRKKPAAGGPAGDPASVPARPGPGGRRCADSAPSFDLIHAWSLRGAALAGLTAGAVPRVATLAVNPEREMRSGQLRRILRRRPALLLAGDQTTRRALRAYAPAASVMRFEPWLAFDRLTHPRSARSALRASLGVAEDTTRVVAAVGDPPERVDAMRAALAVGLTAEAGRPVRLLISPRAANLSRARGVMRDVGRAGLVIADARAERPWEGLDGCDVALALAGGPSLAWAMAAGRPIVAPDAGPMNEWLADARSALLSPDDSAGALARRLRRLIDDPAQGDRLAAAARAEAESLFPISGALPGMNALYGSTILNRPIRAGRADSPPAARPRPATRSARSGATEPRAPAER